MKTVVPNILQLLTASVTLVCLILAHLILSGHEYLYCGHCLLLGVLFARTFQQRQLSHLYSVSLYFHFLSGTLQFVEHRGPMSKH